MNDSRINRIAAQLSDALTELASLSDELPARQVGEPWSATIDAVILEHRLAGLQGLFDQATQVTNLLRRVDESAAHK